MRIQLTNVTKRKDPTPPPPRRSSFCFTFGNHRNQTNGVLNSGINGCIVFTLSSKQHNSKQGGNGSLPAKSATIAVRNRHMWVKKSELAVFDRQKTKSIDHHGASRDATMKKIHLLGLFLLLASCAPQPASVASPTAGTTAPMVVKSTATPAPTKLSGLTATQTWTSSPLLTDLPTGTSAVEGTTTACSLHLNLPADGVVLPNGRSIRFDWDDLPGTQYYLVVWQFPNGTQEQKQSTTSEFTRDIRIVPKPGLYSWMVYAYGPDKKLLCSSISRSFNFATAPTAGFPSATSVSVTATQPPEATKFYMPTVPASPPPEATKIYIPTVQASPPAPTTSP